MWRRSRIRPVGLVTGLVVVLGAVVVAVVGGGPSAGALPATGGSELIRSYPTGLCVDSNDRAPGRAGGEAYSHPCNFGSWQYWEEAPSLRLSDDASALEPFANEYRLVNRQTQLCLDSNAGGEVYTLPCATGNSNQSWIHVMPALPREKIPADENAWPVVYQNLATDRCLSIAGDRLRTVECADGNWTDDMFFRRGY